MTQRVTAFFLGSWLLASAASAEEAVTAGLQVPEEFHVSLYADDDLAHDIYALTLDAAGRVVVAGRGYVKVLHDDDGDGRADRSTLFAKTPAGGARGMVFEGPHLVCTGDNALARYEDHDGDLVADGPPVVLAPLKQAGEHSSNGVVKGPDGWYYVACGNEVGINESHVTTPGSPVRRPHQGAVVRVAPAGARSEVVAHGFRNPYDLAIDGRGSIFLVDSDGERDQYLPWYSPTRLFDVAPGMHHGWMLSGWSRSWNRPPWFFDNAPRLLEIGRGSPTGALVYRHRQFPEQYRGGVFSCCWSLGCIYHFPLSPHGAGYASRRDVFLQATGGAGFAPVDMAVGPQGDLFVAIGGRGTRGGVFRIAYDSPTNPAQQPADNAPLRRVLAADQPLASWSRAQWIPLAKELGAEALERAACDSSLSAQERVRAVEVLVEVFDGVRLEAARNIISVDDPEVNARVAWALARRPRGNDGEALLVELTYREDPWVKRAAWEALAALPKLTDAALDADWADLNAHDHPRVRAAAILAAARLSDHGFTTWDSLPQLLEESLTAYWVRHYRGQLSAAHFAPTLELFHLVNYTARQLEVVRLLQILLGDVRVEPTQPAVYAGYAPNETPWEIPQEQRRNAMRVLADAFPSGDEPLDRELARLAGMLQVESPRLIASLSEKWTPETSVEDDIHYLIVLSRLPGERDAAVTRRTASALANLHHKMTRGKFYASRFWPERVGETLAELARRDPNLAEALVDHPALELPDQSILAMQLPLEQRRLAARRLLERADDEWSPDLVRLVAALPPEEHLPALRAVWDNDYSLRETAILLLAESPHADDVARFVETLRNGSPDVVTAAAKALIQLNRPGQPAEMATALDALRQYAREKQYVATAQALHQLLSTWTGGVFADAAVVKTNPAAAYETWAAWFAKAYPQQAADANAKPADEGAALLARLETIDWSHGDTERGRQAFQKFSCARCHEGASRWGPDLKGVGSRFARRDLFLAIVDPNRDVSPTYRAMQVVTGSGRVVVGQIVYESPEATLVQTGPDTTVRIADDEIRSLGKSLLSPMPTGLLRSATDEDLADLYAYLRSLDNGK